MIEKIKFDVGDKVYHIPDLVKPFVQCHTIREIHISGNQIKYFMGSIQHTNNYHQYMSKNKVDMEIKVLDLRIEQMNKRIEEHQGALKELEEEKKVFVMMKLSGLEAE